MSVLTMNDRPLHHVCYIVDDIPEAVDRWVESTGAGPFFSLGKHIEFDEALFEGEPCTFDHSSAIGRWGPVFLELIALHEVTPALEARYYTGGAGGGNIAHAAYLVDDLAAETDRLEAAGNSKFFHLRQGPVEISVFDAPLLGHAVEVLGRTDEVDGLFGLIAGAAEGWGGGDSLRELPEG